MKYLISYHDYHALALSLRSIAEHDPYSGDGGQTSVMTFGDRIVNVPYKGGRACSDFLVVCEQNEMGE
ncbi:MAG: hypothetical protein E7559_06710 [Ruminococcaceae bacterium]|nr:hypothetical protein [Oscillospiraceae bacterium]